MKAANEYYGSHMTTYEKPRSYGGSSPLKVLPELTGEPWDEVALAVVGALNPTSIRVSTGGLKCDSRIGRITVIVDDKNIIEEVEMEIVLPIVDEGKTHEEFDEIWHKAQKIVDKGYKNAY